MSTLYMEEFDESTSVKSLLEWIEDVNPEDPDFMFGRDGDGKAKLIITYKG